MIEVWKPVIGYEGKYSVSNTGKVISLERKIKIRHKKGFRVSNEKPLVLQLGNTGRYRVSLSKNGVVKRHFVHRLVAAAFLSPIDGKNIVNHIDGNPLNNNVENLEWCTYSENELHSVKALGKKCYLKGLMKDKYPFPTKAVAQYDLEGNLIRTLKSARHFEDLGFSNSKVSMVANGKRKTHKKFTFKYV